MISDPAPSPLANFQAHHVDTIDEAFALKRWLGERHEGGDVLGLDTESGGLKPERDRLRMVQFGDLNTGWSIPWERWGGVAEEILKAWQGEWVLHNAPHDVRFLQLNIRTWKPPWHRIHDTMTQAHIYDPTRPKGLKPLASQHVDHRAVAGQKLLDDTMTRNGWTWDTIPSGNPLYSAYAALDPVLTAHIHHKLRPAIRAAGMDRVYDLEMAVLRIVTNMMLKGVRADTDYCTRKSEELRAWVATAREQLAEGWGIINATSNNQVIRCLEGEGFQFIVRTEKGGQFKLDKEILESIDHPVARTVLAIRKAEKTCAAYLDNFSHLVDPLGIVRCSIQSLGARTGRMSVSDPSLQNLTRGDPTVRDVFVPREGNVFISCDADQIEARLATHFSRDAGLIQAFHLPEDFYCTIASEIFHEKITNKKDERRQLTKNTIFASIYGAGVAKMAQTAHVPFEQMEPVKRAFDQRFPGLKDLMRQVTTVAHARYLKEGLAYVMTPLGRRLPTTGEAEYKLVNYLIQGHAAEVLKEGLINLDTAGLGELLVLPVHDEVILDVPRGQALEVKSLVEETLTDLTRYAVPLTWSADILPTRWGDKFRPDILADAERLLTV